MEEVREKQVKGEGREERSGGVWARNKKKESWRNGIEEFRKNAAA
jgi:hypothetical protein